MFATLFPACATNRYRGQWLALWILWPIVVIKVAMGFNCAGLNPFVHPRRIMTGIDAIPLDAYGPEAADMMQFLFSAWGLGLLLLGLIGVVVLARYRALTPLLALVLVVEQLGRKLISAPPTAEAAATGLSTGAIVNWGFTVFLALAFVLALWPRAQRAMPA